MASGSGGREVARGGPGGELGMSEKIRANLRNLDGDLCWTHGVLFIMSHCGC